MSTKMSRAARAERREKICTKYRESGMSQAAFCRKHGIPLSTLQYWLNGSRWTVGSRSTSKSASTSLVPIGVASVAAGSRVLRLRSGSIEIEVERPVSREELASIMAALASL